jgi:hypothetical protein
LDLLNNKSKVLKLGYHAVKGRGQKALNGKMTIAQSLDDEAEFFDTNNTWRRVDPGLVGIPALKDKLVKLLESVVVQALPSVLMEINAKLERSGRQLEALGQPLDTAAQRRSLYSSAVENYTMILQAAILGIVYF